MSKAYTKWLKRTVAEMQEHAELFPGDIDAAHGKVLKALRIALASLEAEPVCYLTWHQGLRAPDDCEEYVVEAKPGDKSCDGSPAFPVYAAPPAPVSEPDDLEMKPILKDGHQIVGYEYKGERYSTIAGCAWNSAIRTCRAAMLQGAENAETPTTMQTSPALYSSAKIAESPSGNSPVIPDELIRRIAFNLVYLSSDEKVRSNEDSLFSLVRQGIDQVRKELAAPQQEVK